MKSILDSLKTDEKQVAANQNIENGFTVEELDKLEQEERKLIAEKADLEL